MEICSSLLALTLQEQIYENFSYESSFNLWFLYISDFVQNLDFENFRINTFD